VPVVALYEVHKILSRKLPANVVVSCLDVMRSGLVLDLTDRRAIAAAADIAVAHHLAMADTVFYRLALEHHATFWTQDADYEALPGVKFFKKP